MKLEGGVRIAVPHMSSLSRPWDTPQTGSTLLQAAAWDLPPFVPYSPLLVDGKEAGAETPLFPPIFVSLLEVEV